MTLTASWLKGLATLKEVFLYSSARSV